MLIAGIDTTWSAIGSSLWHLAQHPEHRERLRNDPGVVPFAIEELAQRVVGLLAHEEHREVAQPCRRENREHTGAMAGMGKTRHKKT